MCKCHHVESSGWSEVLYKRLLIAELVIQSYVVSKVLTNDFPPAHDELPCSVRLLVVPAFSQSLKLHDCHLVSKWFFAAFEERSSDYSLFAWLLHVVDDSDKTGIGPEDVPSQDTCD